MSRPEGREVDPAWAERRWGWPLFAVALFVRLISIASEDAYLHPDALWQGLEPAFGVVWGEYEMSWEFQQGARSWLWPGFLALPMFVTKVLGLAGPGSGMGAAVFGARFAVALLDVLACVLLTRFVLRCSGPIAAGGVGLLLALHPAFVVTGAQPLIDVPAALALVLAMSACDRHPELEAAPGWMDFAAGACVAFAIMLRIQLAPAALVLAGVWSYRRFKAGRLAAELPRAIAAGVLVILAFGFLDWLTWDGWWHSLRTYLRFNLSEQGQSFGKMPVDRYWAHADLALPYLKAPLVGLALLGMWRRPTWGMVVLAFWLPHQLLEYRVWRFIYPGLFPLVASAGCGFVVLVEELETRGVGDKAGRLMALAGVLVFSGSALQAGAGQTLWETTWAFDQGGASAVQKMRGVNRAALWLSGQADPGVTVNQVVPHAGAPGRALFGHAGPRIHTMSLPALPPEASRAGAWIVPAEAESQVAAAGLEVAWKDSEGAVVVARPAGAR